MPKNKKQTAAPAYPSIAAGPTLAEAIAMVRRGLVLRAHLAAAGDDRKFRDAGAIIHHWVIRIVAAGVRTPEDIALKRAFVAGLSHYRFVLDARRQAMADAVLADEARRLLPRPSAH